MKITIELNSIERRHEGVLHHNSVEMTVTRDNTPAMSKVFENEIIEAIAADILLVLTASSGWLGSADTGDETHPMNKERS